MHSFSFSLPTGEASKINKLDRAGKHQEAGELFLELMKQSSDPGKWQQLRNALHQEGNSAKKTFQHYKSL